MAAAITPSRPSSGTTGRKSERNSPAVIVKTVKKINIVVAEKKRKVEVLVVALVEGSLDY